MRLMQLPNGNWIDPAMVTRVALWENEGSPYRAGHPPARVLVHLDDVSEAIPCDSVEAARTLRDTLAARCEATAEHPPLPDRVIRVGVFSALDEDGEPVQAFLVAYRPELGEWGVWDQTGGSRLIVSYPDRSTAEQHAVIACQSYL